MPFLSLGLRAIVNVEALNMVESVGNIVRRRKAAIVYKRGDEYVVRWVPAVSGESISHSYQVFLARIAEQRGLPVCEYCKIGEFVKHADQKVFGSSQWESELMKMLDTMSKMKDKEGKVDAKRLQELLHSVEKTIIENCVVEDVGGFLYAGKQPVKRTSRFASSFMVAAMDAVEKAVIETQFQVRHAPSASQRWNQAQMPYNVETASAVYAWSFYLDAGGVGCTSMVRRECLPLEERIKRVKAAVDALALMLDSRIFGAKQTRFNPIVGYEVALIAVSRPLPFNVSPPAIGVTFIEDTLKRAKSYREHVGGDVVLLAYVGPLASNRVVEALNETEIQRYDTLLDALAEAKRLLVEWLRAETT